MLYNFDADSFYIMKLCRRLFVLYCRSRPKDDKSMHFDPHFEEVRGGVEPWWMARWKSRADSPNCTVLRAVVLTQYRRVTDGQTDGRNCCS